MKKQKILLILGFLFLFGFAGIMTTISSLDPNRAALFVAIIFGLAGIGCITMSKFIK